MNDTLTSGQALEWLHVLAMCSRDQESRYDRFWNWRHTRSESGTPKFGKPKVDAGLCVRLILGLLDPAESALRKRLEEFEATLERTNADIRKKREEPAFHITGLRNTLVNQFGIRDAADAPLDDSLIGLRRSRTPDLRRSGKRSPDRSTTRPAEPPDQLHGGISA